MKKENILEKKIIKENNASVIRNKVNNTHYTCQKFVVVFPRK